MDRFASMIVAEDLRVEMSGKLVIVGMYTGDIGIPEEKSSVPQLSFVFMVQGLVERLPGAAYLEIELPGGAKTSGELPPVLLLTGGGRKHWLNKHRITLVNPILNFGEIRGKVRYADDGVDIDVVGPCIVKLDSATGPTASPPPS